MSRLLLASLLTAALLPTLPAQTALRGVNIAGAEFGEGTLPGELDRHYTFNSEPTFAYFPEQGLPLLRVPIRWERIQPELFGPLDANYLFRLTENITWARNHGGRVIIDVHNYGRYKINGSEFILDTRYNGEIRVPSEALSDLWVRLAAEFGDNPGVYGYGLMNEPHDMGPVDWKAISQEVVTAIRNTGDTKAIFIGGDSWSSAERWVLIHGADSWINDPADNFYYEAHLYFDEDASGRYFLSYDQERARNPNLDQIGPERLHPFRTWCANNEVRCFVGEYGIPNNDDRWLTVLDNLLTAMDQANMAGTYWAAGDWWGGYALSVQPENGEPKRQLATLQAHKGPAFATSVSAASSGEGALPSDSLASAYGSDFTDQVVAASTVPLPTELGGVRLDIVLPDEQTRPAELVFVSPGQINYLLPGNLPAGPAELRIYRNGQLLAIEPITIAAVTPGLFAANGRGTGAPAGQIMHVAEGGARDFELLADYNEATATFTPRPIAFRDASERIFLILYGTGFRHFSGETSVRFNNGLTVPAAFVGAQPDYPGLDQVNVEIPRTLAGTGSNTLTVTIDGKTSNELIIQLN